jgi:hypothetical protein
MSIDAPHNAPPWDLARHDDAVRNAAQRNDDAVLEGNRLGQAVETLANPIEVPVKERACFLNSALYGQRHDHRAPRTAHS